MAGEGSTLHDAIALDDGREVRHARVPGRPASAPGTPVRTVRPRWSARLRKALLGLALPVAALVAAEVAVRAGWVDPGLFPSPLGIVQAIDELGWTTIFGHVAASTSRVLSGFVLGASGAVVLGTWVGLSARAEAVLEPTFQALRAIPSLAWVPLLLLWFGIDETPKLILIAIGAFFPVYMGVSSGFKDVDRKLVEVARMYGFGASRLARTVLLPAAMPSIWTGLRNGLSLAWMFMVAAELIAASRGLGYLLTDGRETGRADLVLAAIVLLAVLGKASDSVMQWLERQLLGWRDTMAHR